MGLDAIELLCAVEDEFGIVIADDVASRCTTPRLLAEAVAEQLASANTTVSACVNQVQFYRLRAWLQKAYGVERRSIRPDTLIDAVLPHPRGLHWQRLKHDLGKHAMPDLRSSMTIKVLLAGAWLGGFVALKLAGISTGLSLVLTLILGLWLISRFNQQLGSILPDGMAKLSDLIPHLTPLKQAELSPDDILRRVIQLTSVQLGIPLQDIQPDSRFVQDLGLD